MASCGDLQVSKISESKSDDQAIDFEEALNKAGFGKYNYVLLVSCAGMVISMGFDAFSLSFVVPTSACELSTTTWQQGILASLPFLGTLATSHMWGYLGDTRGRRTALRYSLICCFVPAILSSFSPNWLVLGFLKVCSAAAVSGTYAIAMTMLGECTPAKQRQYTLLLANSMFMTGQGLMAVIAIPVLQLNMSIPIPFLKIQFNQWRLLNMIFTIPLIILYCCLYFIWESPKFLLSSGRQEEAIEVLARVYAINSGRSSEEYRSQVKSLTLSEEHAKVGKGFWVSVKNQTVPIVRSPYLKHTIILTALYSIIYFCGNPFLVWFPTMLKLIMDDVINGKSISLCEMVRAGANSSESSTNLECSMDHTSLLMIFLLGMVLSLSSVAISLLVNKVGRRRILLAVHLIAGVAGLCLNWLYVPWLAVAFYIVNASVILSLGLLSSFTVDVYPTYLRAMAVSLSLMVGRLSSLAGVNILRVMLDSVCEASFYMFASVTLVGIIIGYMLPADK